MPTPQALELAIPDLLKRLGHESGCAIYDYSGESCGVCRIGKVHATGLCHRSQPHRWVTTPAKPCNCASTELASGIEALIRREEGVKIADKFEDVRCPTCKFIVAGIPNYCANCGAKFDWI